MSRVEEAAWLRKYDSSAFPPFAVTVDLAIFTIRAGVLCTLLVRRGEPPYRGWWALPGGHLRHGVESSDQAAARELAEETGMIDGIYLEQLATYSEPNRDPRLKAGLQVVSVAYVALAANLPEPVAGTDAADARWWPVEDLPTAAAGRGLAFDHGHILNDAVTRVRAKLEYSTLALQFVADPFSLSELRRVYLAVWGTAPDLPNFRRKVLATPGFVVPAEPESFAGTEQRGRPPSLYRRGPATVVNPPITR